MPKMSQELDYLLIKQTKIIVIEKKLLIIRQEIFLNNKHVLGVNRIKDKSRKDFPIK